MSTNTAQKFDFQNNSKLGVSEASLYLKVTPSTLRRLDNDGKIESERLSNGYRQYSFGDVVSLKFFLEEEKARKKYLRNPASLVNVKARDKVISHQKAAEKPVPANPAKVRDFYFIPSVPQIKSLKTLSYAGLAVCLILTITAGFRFIYGKGVGGAVKSLATRTETLTYSSDFANVLGDKSLIKNEEFHVNILSIFNRPSTFKEGTTTTDATMQRALFIGGAEMQGLKSIDTITETSLEKALDITGDVVSPTAGGLNNVKVTKINGVTLGDVTAKSGNILMGKGSSWVSLPTTQITALGSISTGTWEADPIMAGFGGTGLATYTTGDMIYASASDTLSQLNIGTTNQILSSVGGIPKWVAVSAVSGVTGTGVAGYLSYWDTTTNISYTTGIYWDDVEQRLGIGNASPVYKLDVTGTAGFSSTIHAPNIGAGTDDSVVILNSSGNFVTDEIDSRVWGATLLDGSSLAANYLTKVTDANTIANSLIYDSGAAIGLGTTAPSQILDVAGAVRLGANGSANDVLNTTVGANAPSGILYWGARTVCDSSGNCAGSGAGIGGSGTTSYVPRFASQYNIENSIMYDNGTSIGIGTTVPGASYTLDVSGATNTTSLYVGGTQITSTAAELNYLDQTTVTAGGLMYGNGTYIANTGALTGILKGNSSSAPTALTSTAGYATYWSDANTLAGEAYLSLSRGGTGIGSTNPAIGSLLIGNGTGYTLSAMSGDATIAANGTLTLATQAGLLTGTYNNVTVNTKGLVTSASNVSYESPLTFSNGLTRSDNSVVLGGALTGNTRIYDSSTRELLYFDNTNGRLGIGTTAPGEKLEIAGNLKFSGTDPNVSTTTGFDFDLGDLAGSYNFDIRNSGDTNILSLNSLGSLTLDGASGSSGVLTFTPTGATDVFTINRAGSGTGASFRVNDAGSGDLSPFIVTSTGNVGIGTTNPLAMFSVGNNSQFRVDSTGNLTRINNIAYSWPSSQASVTGSMLSNDASGNLTWSLPSGTGTQGYWTRFGTTLFPYTPTDNLGTAGNMGIGTTSPKTLLDVNSLLNVLSGGNVGIGITTPGSKLSINGAVSIGSIYSRLAAPADGLLVQGNVGIGVSNPLSKLHVKGTSSVATIGAVTSLTADGTFAASTGWTVGTGWTIGSGVATHATGVGNTNPLSGTSTATSTSTVYQVNFTVAVTTPGDGFTVSLGGQDSGTTFTTQTGVQTIYIRPSASSGTLSFTPGPLGTFVGTLDDVTIYAMTASVADSTIESSNGTGTPLEIRAGGNNTYGLFLGQYAGQFNTTTGAGNNGLYNTFIGYQSGRFNTAGYRNTAIGSQALYSNTTGYANIAIGIEALYSNTAGYNNTADGYQALYNNTTGYNNIAIGNLALIANTTGYDNIAIGVQALYNNTTGYNNTANGRNALNRNTTGYNNTAIGLSALNNNTTGYNNTANGSNALSDNTTGISNTATGTLALSGNRTGYENTAAGQQALYNNTTGYQNTATGRNALYNLEPTSKAITGFADSGTSPGTKTTVTSAGHAQIDGTTVQISGTTNYNGSYAISNATTDTFDITKVFTVNDATGWWGIDSEGRYNTAEGYGAGQALTTGSNNLFLGYKAGDALTTGSTNIVIGYNIDLPTTASSNMLDIGNLIYATGLSSTGTTVSSGNVGIGTSNPLAMFSVGNNSQFRVDSSGNLTRINNVAYSWPSSQASVNGSMLSNDASGNLTWSSPAGSGTQGYWTRFGTTLFPTTSTDNLGTAGNLGVGTTSPKTLLDVNSLLNVLSGGNVGIGTTNPQFGKLDIVASESSPYNTTLTSGLAISGSGSGYSLALEMIGGISPKGWIQARQKNAANGVSLSLNPIGGNVGIGTTAPIFKLDIANSQYVTDSGSIRLGSYEAQTRITMAGDRAMFGYVDPNMILQGGLSKGITFNVNNATFGSGEVARIDTAGNLGIGTTGPSYRLDVYNSSGASGLRVLVNGASTGANLEFNGTSYNGILNVQASHANNGNAVLKLAPTLDNNAWAILVDNNDSRLKFIPSLASDYTSIAGGARMTITPAGLVGIGTTGPSYLLEARSTAAGGANTLLVESNNRADGTGAILEFNGSSYNGHLNIKAATTSAGGSAVLSLLPYTQTGKQVNLLVDEVDAQKFKIKVGGTAGLTSLGGIDALTIDQTGNIGVGTTGPGSKLSIGGAVSIGSIYSRLAAPADGLLVQGNVGIGVSNPTAKLQVKGTSSVAAVGTSNLLTADGTFAASTGWTVGTGWTIGSGVATHATGNIGVLSGTSTATSATTVYQVNFTVAVTTAGDGFNVSLGGKDSGTATTTAGAKTIYIIPSANSGTLSFTPGIAGTFVGTIDDVTIYAMTASTADSIIESSDGTGSPMEIRAGGSNTYGLFLGQYAGQFNTTTGGGTNGTNNTFIGNSAGRYNNTGYNNTATGYEALYANTTGYYNTALGRGALYANTAGSTNTAIGNWALTNNTTGSYNTAVGNMSLYLNTTGTSNTANGYLALKVNTSGYDNIATGVSALYNNTTGYRNTATGVSALTYNTTGIYNVAIGSYTNFLAPTNNFTVAASSGSNLSVGQYRYRVSFVLNATETVLSDNVSITIASGANQAATLSSIPTYSGPMTCTARNIYRSVMGQENNYYYVGQIADNSTTTYVDNTKEDVTEAGDASNQLSSWILRSVDGNQSNNGMLYWNLTISGTTRTVDIFSNAAKTTKVASGSRTSDGSITIYAQARYSVYGSVTVAYTIDDTDASNTLDLGVLPDDPDNSIMLGGYATAIGSSQFVLGSSTAPITSAFLGEGIYSTTPQTITLNATGGQGTNIAGASLILAGGIGTGSGLGGNLLFQTSTAGGSGTGANTLSERMRIDSTGNLGIGTTNPLAMFSVGNNSQFRVDSSGNLTRINNIAYSWPASQATINGSMLSNDAAGNLAWSSPTGSGTQGYWTRFGTTLFPYTPTDNLGTAGNLGVGTTSPKTLLDVNSLFNVLSTGNVGIGTTAPQSMLDVRIVDTAKGLASFGYGSVTSSGGGFAAGYVNAGGTISATNFGSIALGEVKKMGAGDPSILSSGEGSFAGGYVGSGGSSASLISSGYGSFAWGGNNLGATASLATAFGSGFTNSTANSFMVGYSSTPTLTVTSANLGIGTVSPSALLDVNGTAWLRGTGTSGLYVNSSGNVGIGTTGPGAKVDVNLGNGKFKITGNPASGGIIFEVNDQDAPTTQVMVVTNAGNVGIGTTSPGAKLEISNTGLGLATPAFIIDGDDASADSALIGLSRGANGRISGTLYSLDEVTEWFTGTYYNAGSPQTNFGIGAGYDVTNQKLVITTAGNVGIGTVSPSALLDVNGTAWLRGTGTSGLYVNSSGNVGIGTTSPVSKLDVNGNVSLRDSNSILYIGSSSTTTGAVHMIGRAAVDGYHINGSSAGDLIIAAQGGENIHLGTQTTIDAPASARLTILATGLVGIGTTNPLAMFSVGNNSQFRVDSSGNLTRINDIAYSWPASQASVNGSMLTNDASGNLAWSSPTGSGTQGYWTRFGTTLFPYTPTDNLGTSGNLGVGTTSPKTLLDVNSLFNVTSAGNVGIGTTAPTGKLDIVDTSASAASLELTNNTVTTLGVGINTIGVLDLQSTSLTTGNFLNMELNALTSGKGINLTSTSTGFTGDLANFTASGSNAAVTGSVLKVGLTGGSAIGTALNITTAGSSGYALRVNDDGTYIDQTPFVVDYTGNVGIGMSNPGSRLYVRGSSSIATVDSSNLLTADGTFAASTGWTVGVGWTIGSGVATHATGVGNTNPLSGTSTATTTWRVYQVNFTVAVTTAGDGFTVSLGGQDSGNTITTAGAKTVYINPSASTGTLSFTPGAAGTFVGTIDNVTIYALSNSTADASIESSDGTGVGGEGNPLEIRAGGSSLGNLFIGNMAGRNTTTGVSNLALGQYALAVNTTGYGNLAVGGSALTANTTGYYNAAFGPNALSSNSTGDSNTAIGYRALTANTTGYRNTATGDYALRYNTTGYLNTAVGDYVMAGNTTGNYNTAVGPGALNTNSTGSSNVALGYSAGYYETGSNKLFIDNASRSNEADARTKALVYGIFDTAVANQYLTVNGQLQVTGTGNSYLMGNVGIGTTNPLSKLEVSGVGSFSLGSVSAPGISFNGDLNTGLWSSTADTLNLSTGGSERLRINSSGNVGIGTAGPNGKLDVVGNSNFEGLVSIGGGAQQTDRYLNVNGGAVAPTTGTTQYAMTFNGYLSGTSADYGILAAPAIYNNITAASVYGVSVWEPFKGTGAAITSQTGFQVDDLTGGTNNILALLGTRTIPTGNFSLYSASTKASYFAGNVGIGTTTPNYSLTVSNTSVTNGQLNLESTAGVNAVAGINFSTSYTGTAHNGSITSSFYNMPGGMVFTSPRDDTTGNGFYFKSNAGATKMMIDTGTGNIGIGTTAPATKLSTVLSSPSNYPSAANVISISNLDTTNNNMAGIWFNQGDWGGGTSGGGIMGVMTDHTGGERDADLAFYTTLNNTVAEKMRILNNGNVGIGTTNPLSKLEVNGVGSFSLGSVSLPSHSFNGDLDTGMWSSVANTLNFSTGGSERLRIDTSGNVGIGTTGPGALLELNSGNIILGRDDGAKSLKIGISDINANMAIGGGGGNAGYLQFDTASDYSSSISFLTNYPFVGGGVRMLIDKSGNVGIGTTSPQRLLEISGNSPFIRLTNTEVGGKTLEFFAGTAGIGIGTPTTPQQFVVYENAPTNAMQISTWGIAVAVPIRASNGTNLSIQSDGNATTGNTIQIQGSTGGTAWQTVLTAPNVASGNVNLLLANNGGNVGIGTTGPTYNLQVIDTVALGNALGTAGGDNNMLRTGATSAFLNLKGGAGRGKISIGNDSINLTAGNTSGAIKFNYGANSSTNMGTEGLTFGTTGGLSLGSGYVATDPGPGNMIISGNVGIGTMSPGAKLDVNGMGRFGSGLEINGTATNSGTGLFLSWESYGGQIQSYNSKPLIINPSNNVGIGNTGPDEKLDVAGRLRLSYWDSQYTDTYYLNIYQSGASGTFFDSYAASDSGKTMYFRSGGTDTMAIKYNGNVGIGTTAPALKLNVVGTVGYPATSGTTQTGVARFEAASNDSVLDFGVTSAAPWGTWIQSTDKTNLGNTTLLINPNGGMVGIGTTAPNAALEVNAWTSDTYPLLMVKTAANPVNRNMLEIWSGSTSTMKFVIKDSGNVGIGTTNPLSKLEVSGVGSFSLGSVSAPGISFNGDLNTGLWSSTADTLNLSTGGSERLRINSSGNVGIGTTNPATTLHIGGGGQTLSNNYAGLYVNPNADPAQITIENNVGTEGGMFTSGTLVYMGSFSNNNLRFLTNNSTQMTLTTGGNLGIGTTNPLSKLEVSGVGSFSLGSVSAPGISFNGDLNTGLWSSTADTLNLSTGGSERLRINSSGNVGIGTVSPSALLDVNGTAWLRGTGTSGLYVNSSGNVGIGTTGPGANLTVSTTTGATQVFRLERPGISAYMGAIFNSGTPYGSGTNARIQYAQGYLGFEDSSGATRLLIDTLGNVGIGTTGPGAKLDVQGNIGTMLSAISTYNAGGNSMGLYTSMITANAGNNYGVYSSVANSGGGAAYSFYGNAGTLYNAGNVGIGTTVPGVHLDIQGSGTQQLRVKSTDSGGADVRLLSDTTKAMVGTTSNLPLYFYTNNLPNMVLLANGNVGIGTTDPQGNLDIVSPTNTSLIIRDNTTEAGTASLILGTTHVSTQSNFKTAIAAQGIGSYSRADLHFVLNSDATTNPYVLGTDTKVIIKNSGNVGIGTTNPSYKLDVANTLALDTSVARFSKVQFGDSLNVAYFGSYIGYDYTGNERMVLNSRYSASHYEFQIAGAEKVRIDSSGNVGIGTTNPLSKLEVSGVGSFSLGSVSAPGISFNGDLNTGLWSSTADTLNLSTGGSERLRINSSGNVGIGTTSPSSLLSLQSNGNNPTISINDISGDINSDVMLKFNTTGSTRFTLGVDTAASDLFKIYSGDGIAGTSEFVINSTGNVGIGTVSPSALLDVNGTAWLRGTGTSGLYVNSTGNVGIGTTGPNERLEIVNRFITSDGQGANRRVLLFQSPTSGADYAAIDAYGYGTSGGGKNVVFGTNSGGNVGIGTTNPGNSLQVYNASASQALFNGWESVNGASAASGSILIGDTAAYQGIIHYNQTGWTHFYIDNSFNNDAAITQFRMKTSGTPVDAMTILGNGNVGIGTTAPKNKLDVFGGMAIGSYAGVNTATSNGLIISGNVGIGTTSPGAQLEISNPSAVLKLTGATSPYSPTLRFASNVDLWDITNIGNGGDRLDFKMVEVPTYGAKTVLTLRPSGNVGIGTVSPSALLDVNGTAWLRGTGTSGLYVNSSGNIGIGTTAPATKLSTVLSSPSNYPSAANVISISNLDTTNNNMAGIWFNQGDWGGGTSGGGIMGVMTDHTGGERDADLAFYTTLNNTVAEKMRILNNGNVGIGTTAPKNKLDVFGGMAIGSYAGVNTATSNGLIISGNVGIGTTSPRQKLEINGYLGFSSANASIRMGSSGWVLNSSGSDKLELDTPVSGQALVFTTNSEAMRITNTGNVGIGTTSPGAKLDVNGSGITLATFGLRVADSSNNKWFAVRDDGAVSIGTDSPPTWWDDPGYLYVTGGIRTEENLSINSGSSLTWGDGKQVITGTNNTGLMFYTNSSEVMRITHSGNVGIGTTAPSEKLAVAGNIKATSNTLGVILNGADAPLITRGWDTFTSGAYSGIGRWGLFMEPDFLTLGFPNTGTQGLKVSGYNADSTKVDFMTIKGSGNVGIGTTAPGAALDITRSTAGNYIKLLDTAYAGGDEEWLIRINDDGDNDLLFDAPDYGGVVLALENDGKVGIGTISPASLLDVAGTAWLRGTGTSGLYVNSSGNVGIGTTGPAVPLHLLFNNTAVLPQSRIEQSGTGDASLGFTLTGAQGWSIGIDNSDSNKFKISVSGSDVGASNAVTIDTSGNIGIGTTNPLSNLEVTGETRITGLKSANYYVCVDADGDLFESATACAGSDIALKENIQPLNEALSGVLSLSPVSFDWIDKANRGSNREIGFIAQEMEKIFPEVVRTNPDGFKGIKYDVFSAVLTKAIQEQELKIEGLATQVENLTTSPDNPQTEPTSDTAFLFTREMYQSTSDNIVALQSDLDSVKAQLALVIAESSQSSESSGSSVMADTPSVILVAIEKIYNEFKLTLEALGLVKGEDGGLILQNSLNVLGDATFANINVTGKLTSGFLQIDGMGERGASIGTISGDLFIMPQSSGQIAFLGEKIVMDKKGNLLVNEGVIKGNQSFRDAVVLAAGETVIDVPKQWESAPTSVVVTPSYNVKVWVEQVSANGFVIHIDTPSTKEETLYWIAIW